MSYQNTYYRVVHCLCFSRLQLVTLLASYEAITEVLQVSSLALQLLIHLLLDAHLKRRCPLRRLGSVRLPSPLRVSLLKLHPFIRRHRLCVVVDLPLLRRNQLRRWHNLRQLAIPRAGRNHPTPAIPRVGRNHQRLAWDSDVNL